MAWPCSEEKQIHTEWQPILGATKQVKLNAWHSLDVHHSQLCSACSQVPISGLGPDRDQCPSKVPKKNPIFLSSPEVHKYEFELCTGALVCMKHIGH